MWILQIVVQSRDGSLDGMDKIITIGMLAMAAYHCLYSSTAYQIMIISLVSASLCPSRPLMYPKSFQRCDCLRVSLSKVFVSVRNIG